MPSQRHRQWRPGALLWECQQLPATMEVVHDGALPSDWSLTKRFNRSGTVAEAKGCHMVSPGSPKVRFQRQLHLHHRASWAKFLGHQVGAKTRLAEAAVPSVFVGSALSTFAAAWSKLLSSAGSSTASCASLLDAWQNLKQDVIGLWIRHGNWV